MGDEVYASDFIGDSSQLYSEVITGDTEARIVAQRQAVDPSYQGAETTVARLGQPLGVLEGKFTGVPGGEAIVAAMTKARMQEGSKGAASYVSQITDNLIPHSIVAKTESGYTTDQLVDAHRAQMIEQKPERDKLVTTIYDKMSGMEPADAFRAWAKVKGKTISEATIKKIIDGTKENGGNIESVLEALAFDTAVMVGLGISEPSQQSIDVSKELYERGNYGPPTQPGK